MRISDWSSDVCSSDLAGVIDYDPAELVLTVGTGTPLAEIDTLVAAERQMPAFDPLDHGPLFGRPEGHATIGGIVAAGVAGQQRLSCGSAREHLLGFQAVPGRRAAQRPGDRRRTNATCNDLPQPAAGGWGR